MQEAAKLKYLKVALYVFGVFFIVTVPAMMMSRIIWFTIWSSIVYGGIMLIQVVLDKTERANLPGDIPALFLVAIVLWYLMPKQAQTQK